MHYKKKVHIQHTYYLETETLLVDAYDCLDESRTNDIAQTVTIKFPEILEGRYESVVMILGMHEWIFSPTLYFHLVLAILMALCKLYNVMAST